MGVGTRTVVVIATLALVVTGCAPFGGGAQTIATPSPSAAAGTPGPTAGHDPVLVGQFSAFVGGLGGTTDCALGADAMPDVHLLEVDRLAVGATVVVCFLGFDFVEPVWLEIAWPGGSRTVEAAFTGEPGEVDLRDTPGPWQGWVDDFDGAGRLRTWVRPGVPHGPWRLTATQGDLVAETVVEAGPGTTPVMARVAGPDEQTLRFRISGFPPGETPVGLYRIPAPSPAPVDDPFSGDRVTVTLERRIATVEADADGAAVLELDVGDVGEGRWCIAAAVTTDHGWCAARLGPS